MSAGRSALVDAYRAHYGGSEIEADQALRDVELAYAAQQNTELQQALDTADGEHLKQTEDMRLQIEVLSRILEAFPDKHARFGYLAPGGVYVEAEKCADWCYACKLESLQSANDAARALHQPIAGEGGPYCDTCTQEERQPQPVGWWVPLPCPTVQALDNKSQTS